MFFKAVVQVVLLFKLETWVLTPRMGRALGSFQHRVARQITGEAAEVTGGWELGVPTAGDSDGRGGV